MRSKIFFVTNPTTKTKTKNKRILATTKSAPEAPWPLSWPCPLRPVKTERRTMPKMSSIIAALKRVAPVFVLSFPSSFKVSTVIPTDVAAKTIPTKAAFKTPIKSAERSKKKK